MKTIILSLLFLLPTLIFAQNNAIFFGGNGDGTNNNLYAQSSNETIFWGGVNDGTNMNIYAQSSNETIFYGGVNDGVFVSNYAQQSNEMPFKGGVNDGVFVDNYKQVDLYSIYTGGQGDGWANTSIPLSPLPLELISFTARKNNPFHTLNWQTAAEINVDYIEVQWSTNAVNFNTIAKVNAKNNSSNEYSFDYTFYKNGSNYYRLKMVDLDGKFIYSNVLKIIENEQVGTIIIYPNPTASALNIQFTSNIESIYTVYILSMNGQQVYNKSFAINDTPQINVSSLSQGNYILQIVSSKSKQNIPFQKL